MFIVFFKGKNQTQLFALKNDVSGTKKGKRDEIAADRHVNYRKRVYQHEFNLHEYVTEREELLREWIREIEEMEKGDSKIFGKTSKDAAVLANTIEGNDDGGKWLLFYTHY